METEELLFNLSCLESYEAVEEGGWIYYINSPELGGEGDCAIWKVRKDGTENQRLQKIACKVYGIIGVTGKWVYYIGAPEASPASSLLRMMPAPGGSMDFATPQNRKVTVIGSMDRLMTEEEEEDWEDEIEEIMELI